MTDNTFTTLPCTCGHEMASHAPEVTEDTPDEPCDLCECPQFVATPEPDETCEMCGAPWHREPAETEDEYGLICPGAGGSWDNREEYVYSRDQALLRKKRIEESPAAQRAYAERVRSDVSIDVLQANCQELTDEVSPVIQARTLLDSDGADIDAPHLTLKGKTPSRGIDSPVIPNTEDYSLYVGDDQ